MMGKLDCRKESDLVKRGAEGCPKGSLNLFKTRHGLDSSWSMWAKHATEKFRCGYMVREKKCINCYFESKGFKSLRNLREVYLLNQVLNIFYLFWNVTHT